MIDDEGKGLHLQGAHGCLKLVGRQAVGAGPGTDHIISPPVHPVQQHVVITIEIIIDGHGIFIPSLNQTCNERGRADVVLAELQAEPLWGGAAVNRDVPAHTWHRGSGTTES